MKTYQLNGNICAWETAMVGYAINEAKRANEPLTIQVNSYGGDAMAGRDLYNVISGASHDITIDVVGDCMSAATLVLLAVPVARRRSVSNATYLPHEPRYCGLYGETLKAKDLEDMLKSLETLNVIYLNIFKAATTASDAELQSVFRSEGILSAQEMQRMGFVGELYETVTAAETPETEKAEADTAETTQIEIEIEIYDKAREYAIAAVFGNKNTPVAQAATPQLTAKAADINTNLIMSTFQTLVAKVLGLSPEKQDVIAAQIEPVINAAADPNAAVMAAMQTKIDALTAKIEAMATTEPVEIADAPEIVALKSKIATLEASVTRAGYNAGAPAAPLGDGTPAVMAGYAAAPLITTNTK